MTSSSPQFEPDERWQRRQLQAGLVLAIVLLGVAYLLFGGLVE
jgi:hypothetical protein